MINFIYDDSDAYSTVLSSILQPVIAHLHKDAYICSKNANYNMLNVFFFITSYSENSVFIPHGIADKKYRDYSTTNKFGYVFVSGSAWKDKLVKQGMSKEKIFITGYTKLDPLFKKGINRDKCNKKVILFAPTHNGWEGSSAIGLEVSKLYDKYIVLESIHPATSQDKRVTLQKLLDADIVISDTGSMIYEAWALGKPVIFPDWLVKNGVIKDTFEDYIYSNNLGYHVNSFEELEETLNNDLIVDDKVNDFMEGIFPKCLRGYSGLRTATILLQLNSKLGFY